MVKQHRSKTRTGRIRRRLTLVVVALSAGVGLLGFAYAQSTPSFSLNSPVSFPVDI
tara:strand:- start:234918 stop:235085 length:168 start_codon:yes stop_codon:yes gene_type:complete